MLKIFLKNPGPQTDDGTVAVNVDEALMVTSLWDEPQALETHQAYLLLLLLASHGNYGPFSAQELFLEGRRGPRLVTDNMLPDTTAEEFERGMHRLIELGVADAAPPDLRLV